MSEKIGSFTQKRVSSAILNKTNPAIRKSRSGHNIAYIYLGDILITRVRVPNAHNQTISKGLTHKIADSLRLSPSDFNDFVGCPMGGAQYLERLRQYEKNDKLSSYHIDTYARTFPMQFCNTKGARVPP